MKADNRDLLVVAGAAPVCAAVALAVPVTPVRALAAVPLCLVLPGYALTAAIFARREISGLQYSLLTLALSLSTLVLGSLVLDLSPGGIRSGTWTVLLLVVTMVASAVALRRRRLTTGAWHPHLGNRRLRPSDVVLLIIAGVIAAGALTISRLPLKASNALGFTQMWMVSSGAPQAPVLHIGVTSAEKADATYRLVLVGPSGRARVINPQLRLSPGGSYTVDVKLSGTRSKQTIVKAKLYKADSNAVYRRVSAVLPASTGTAVASSTG